MTIAKQKQKYTILSYLYINMGEIFNWGVMVCNTILDNEIF
jgi:hypothetical protein